MKKNSFYFKDFNKLTAKERGLINLSLTTLLKGERLFGASVDDMAHLLWAVNFIVFNLKSTALQQPNSKPKIMIELGLDSRGVFIKLVQPTTNSGVVQEDDTDKLPNPSDGPTEVSEHQPTLQ